MDSLKAHLTSNLDIELGVEVWKSFFWGKFM